MAEERHRLAGCNNDDPVAAAIVAFFDAKCEGMPWVAFYEPMTPDAYLEEGQWFVYNDEFVANGLPKRLRKEVLQKMSMRERESLKNRTDDDGKAVINEKIRASRRQPTSATLQ